MGRQRQREADWLGEGDTNRWNREGKNSDDGRKTGRRRMKHPEEDKVIKRGEKGGDGGISETWLYTWASVQDFPTPV